MGPGGQSRGSGQDASSVTAPAGPFVKICGLTSDRDVSIVVNAGADAAGFLVGLDYPSEDELTAEGAAALIRSMPPFISSVLVTHRAEPRAVSELCRRVPASHLQLHGAFPLDAVDGLRRDFPHLKIIKTVHVVGPASVDAARAVAETVDAILLDTRTEDRLGGTGLTHDWSVSRTIRDAIRPRPVILAGGLDPSNVVEAIHRVQPFGVDVNSGVSRTRGVKASDRVGRFVSAVESVRGTRSHEPVFHGQP
jgi:phosphoribosylanthranilate isomerase